MKQTALLAEAVNTEANGEIGVFYVDNKKATQLIRAEGLQLPDFFTRMNGSIHSICENGSPVKDQFICEGTLLIRNDASGKSYLYDMVDVKEKKAISSISSTENRSEIFEPKPSSKKKLPQTEGDVKQYSLDGETPGGAAVAAEDDIAPPVPVAHKANSQALGNENKGTQHYIEAETSAKDKKIVAGMTDSERTEILREKAVSVPAHLGQADAAIAKESKNLESSKKQIVKKDLVRIGEEFGAFIDDGRKYRNSDMELEVFFFRGSIKESTSKAITDPGHRRNP